MKQSLRNDVLYVFTAVKLPDIRRGEKRRYF